MRYLIVDAELGLTMCDEIPQEVIQAAHDGYLQIVDMEYKKEYNSGDWWDIETL